MSHHKTPPSPKRDIVGEMSEDRALRRALELMTEDRDRHQQRARSLYGAIREAEKLLRENRPESHTLAMNIILVAISDHDMGWSS